MSPLEPTLSKIPVSEQSRAERGIPPSSSASLRAAQSPQKLTDVGGCKIFFQMRNQFLRALLPC